MAELSTVLVSMFDDSIELGLAEIAESHEWNFSNSDSGSDEQFSEAVFLTMSSHLFRIFVAINFNRTSVSGLVAKGLGIKTENLDSQNMNDYLLELGNSICGIFKRELGQCIPALGMSTPNILRRESFSYMDSFHITAKHFRWVKHKNSPVFLTGYYYCPYTEKTLDVHYQRIDTSEDAGELELFLTLRTTI